MDITHKMVGLDDMQKQMSNLVDLATEKKKTKAAAMYAVKPMLDEAKSRAPVAEKAYYRYYRGSYRQRKRGNTKSSRQLMIPGKLKEAIKRKSVELEQSVGAAVYVGTAKALFNRKYYPFYWRFLERGTPKMAAKPIFRPTFDAGKYLALQRFKSRYKKYIDAIVKRQKLESLQDDGE